MSKQWSARYFNQASSHLENAITLLDLERSFAFRPHGSSYYAMSLIHPLWAAGKCFANGFYFLKGVVLCCNAAFNEPTVAIPQVLGAMLKEMSALLINMLNTLASIVLIVTRGLATAARSGCLLATGMDYVGNETTYEESATFWDVHVGMTNEPHSLERIGYEPPCCHSKPTLS